MNRKEWKKLVDSLPELPDEIFESIQNGEIDSRFYPVDLDDDEDDSTEESDNQK